MQLLMIDTSKIRNSNRSNTVRKCLIIENYYYYQYYYNNNNND